MKPPLRILLGPTASGKERVALSIAEATGAVIISVDSMKIYRGMDIGTATPPAEVLKRVPHRCVNIVDPGEPFSAARYHETAEAAMAELDAAGRAYILSGGTPLYHKVLTEGIFDGPPADPALRRRLEEEAEAHGVEALHERLSTFDPDGAGRIHPRDLRRIVRALEVFEQTGRPITEHQTQFGRLRSDRAVAMVGLHWPRDVLHERIHARVDRMLAEGLEAEARALYDREPPLWKQARAAVGYAELFDHFDGHLDRPAAVELIRRNTRRLAKSQMTWFRKFDCDWIEMEAGRGAEALAAQVRELWARRLQGGDGVPAG
jgi:tRNA dimethylallyltransferase